VKTPAILLALGLALAGCGSATAPAVASQATTATASNLPALTGRVVDTAGLLTPAERTRLTAELAALEQRTSDQLVVVTTRLLGGRTIAQYGLALGNAWHVGQPGKDNGVLLIVASNQRQVRIEVGHGLEAILTDARAQRIIDDAIVPRFRESDWHGGIEGGARAIIATLVAHAAEPRQGRR
jgi:uncharacterized protein